MTEDQATKIQTLAQTLLPEHTVTFVTTYRVVIKTPEGKTYNINEPYYAGQTVWAAAGGKEE